MTLPSAELRPTHLEEWLDALPYADFDKTCQRLLQALSETNREDLKASVRLELMAQYIRPYEYLLDTWIKQGEPPSLQTMDITLAHIERVKKIALEIAYGLKLGIDESLMRKTRWLHSKPPLPAINMALRLLSHALLLNYQEYAPVTQILWREIHDLYATAEQLSGEDTPVAYPVEEDDRQGTVSRSYKQICTTALVDPHHLPYGAVWQIYDQLGDWASRVRLLPFKAQEHPAAYFVIDLAAGAAPLSLTRFSGEDNEQGLRLLDCNPLQSEVQSCLETLRNGRPLPPGLHLQGPHLRFLLRYLLKAWGLPPKRLAPRRPRQDQAEMICGINAAYYHLNGDHEFAFQPPQASGEAIVVDGEDRQEWDPALKYRCDNWQFIDEGPGGFAVYSSIRPHQLVRVGELACLQTEQGDWLLGAIRWMMIREEHEYRTGIQLLTRKARPVAVRATTGNELDKAYRRGFLFQRTGAPQDTVLLTSRGIYGNDRSLEILLPEREEQTPILVHGADLIETTVAFDEFVIHSDTDQEAVPLSA